MLDYEEYNGCTLGGVQRFDFIASLETDTPIDITSLTCTAFTRIDDTPASVILRTDPQSQDSDEDGVSDFDEVEGYTIDLFFDDPTDTITVTTDPFNPDHDGDTLSDGDEARLGTNPTVADANRALDNDGDGLVNFEEDKGWIVTYIVPPVGESGLYVISTVESRHDTTVLLDATNMIDISNSSNPPRPTTFNLQEGGLPYEIVGDFLEVDSNGIDYQIDSMVAEPGAKFNYPVETGIMKAVAGGMTKCKLAVCVLIQANTVSCVALLIFSCQ